MVGRISVWLLALGMALAGAWLGWGGTVLIANGGSWYYLPAGLALVATAAGLALRRAWALVPFGLVLWVTLGWALWESGLDFWPLVARLAAPAVLGLALLLPSVSPKRGFTRTGMIGLPAGLMILLLIAALLRSDPGMPDLKGATPIAEAPGTDGDWKVWGRTLDGNRNSPLGQITNANVGRLELAWQFKSDVPPGQFHGFEATPLAADGKLYVCLDRNVVVALDQETGKQVWRYDAKPDLEGTFSANCRGVSWYDAPPGTEDCAKRILFGVNDGRMMAVDAQTGQLCQSFGQGGQVDLKEGLGQFEKGMAYPTSPPTIVNGVAMTSGWVTDGVRTKSPSGGIRAYDALTGKLLWVWDSGREEPARPLAPGETYTLGAPNAWGVFSGDEALGLVYAGLGVETPDYFGAQRSAGAEKYSTSIVALDVKTGKPRWHFQTVHHDIWDYDIGSQPVLTDLKRGVETIPALIGPTKRGQFFVLDRRTGAPIFPVEEKPVPQGAAPEDWTAKTQPYSTGFANVAGPPLSEKTMWGATPLDQLACRIAFRRARYEGDFTPPGLRPAIFYPGSAGGSNWGSVTIDAARGLMISNSLYMADTGRLISRAEADRMATEYSKGGKASSFGFPQKGTPYAMDRTVFLGPFGVPCQQPPFGRLNAIDLATGKLVWSRPLGDASAAGPFGLESHLPITMGMPNFGGSLATAGGVTFIAASQDRTFRAFDTANGKALWSHRLPAIAASTPMTFRSKSGRQLVVIAAGGHPALPGPLGDGLYAFALPAKR
ncbi:MAG: membrane-bound PQQ-dependent dehydrogenase, glucose/quinate/shikimate family [Novosphingobium sp.]